MMSTMVWFPILVLLIHYAQCSATPPRIHLVRDGKPVVQAHVYVYEIKGEHTHEIKKLITNHHGSFPADFLHHQKEFEFKIFDRCGKVEYNCNNPCYQVSIESKDLDFNSHRVATVDIEDEQFGLVTICI